MGTPNLTLVKMPVYEVTANVPIDVRDKWLEYMKLHMDDLIKTKCFNSATMRKDKENDDVFVISYFYGDDAAFESYKKLHQAKLQQDHRDHFDTVRATLRILDDPLIDIDTT